MGSENLAWICEGQGLTPVYQGGLTVQDFSTEQVACIQNAWGQKCFRVQVFWKLDYLHLLYEMTWDRTKLYSEIHFHFMCTVHIMEGNFFIMFLVCLHFDCT
jgi:hypothetical protein